MPMTSLHDLVIHLHSRMRFVLIYFEYINDQKMLWSEGDDCYPSHMKVTPVGGTLYGGCALRFDQLTTVKCIYSGNFRARGAGHDMYGGQNRLLVIRLNLPYTHRTPPCNVRQCPGSWLSHMSLCSSHLSFSTFYLSFYFFSILKVSETYFLI